MKNIIAISTVAFILVIVFICCFTNLHAQATQDEDAIETEQGIFETSQHADKSRLRMSFVKTADFYLRDGQFVFGRLVSEDKNKITVEQLNESRIIVSTYGKRQVDTRTLRTKSVPESRYYMDLAEYFTGRTWDFRDDTDDFIQAIRCYEKARQSVVGTQRQDSEKIEQINERIKQLQADRQVWLREIESRARLKKLEFEATIEARIKELSDRVNANTQQLNESMKLIDKFMADTKHIYGELQRSISDVNKDVSRQFEILQERIESNKELIDRYYRWYRYPEQYYYHYYSRRRDSKSDDDGK